MLALDTMFTIDGHVVGRDYIDPTLYYYLPDERVHVADAGRGLELVVYTENVEDDIDFSQSEDHAGAFLTLQTETGPGPEDVERLRQSISGRVGADVRLTQAPFVGGSATLYVLGTASGNGQGMEVSVAGSAKPSLYGRHTAAFSVRLGGKAANLLYETVRRSADPQVVICYTLEYLVLRPAYNLEIEIDFQETFAYCRKRIGINALVAKIDLDLLTQELINKGSITIKETDYTGDTSRSGPLAAEGGVLKIVRELLSSTLFQTVPIPTPNYRALPDSATQALGTASGTSQILSVGGDTPSRTPITAGSDLRVTHTPHGSVAAGAAIPLSVTVQAGTGVKPMRATVRWRVSKSGAYRDLVLNRNTGATPGANPATPDPAASNPTASNPASAPPRTRPAPAGGAAASPPDTQPAGGGATPGTATSAGSGTPPRPSGGATPAPAGGATPAPPDGEITFTGHVPAQPSGTAIEYNFSVEGTKGDAAVSQTLPADQPEAKPFTLTVGSSQPSAVAGLKIPETDGPLLGFSLQVMDITQQVKRTFSFSRSEAGRRQIHPSGVLSSGGIGPAFDPGQQITRVALGEGPFRILVIKAQAGFEFDSHHVLLAVIHIEYGTTPTGQPLRTADITLTKAQPTGQTQFFADDAGSQEYSYHITFTYDPAHVIGAVNNQLRSRTFTGVRTRSITVDLAVHSPLLPIQIQPGRLRFDDLVDQVQVRIAPTRATTEGRTLVIDSAQDVAQLYLLPADPAHPSYYMRQETFFPHDSTVVEVDGVTDTQIVVNEPTEDIFRATPMLVDPWNLVKEALVESVFQHANGQTERATLHLRPESPKDTFSVRLQPGDTRSWEATSRFVMNMGEPMSSVAQQLQVSEPFIGLVQAGHRVVAVELLEDPTIFSPDHLLAIKIIAGGDLTDETSPASTVLLRNTRLTGAMVVPGLRAGDPVQIAIEAIRRGQPATRTTSTLPPPRPPSMSSSSQLRRTR